MSVQVRRRREAAAYLSTFAGAQGELIVDTTNNRVQVHDGATPNGFPAAAIRDLPGFNLGINTNGAINQRGVSGTVTLAAGQYGHDRMKGGAAGCTYTFATATNGDTTFTITAGSLVQAIDVQNIVSTALWLTWTGTAQARVYQGAASGAPAYGAGVAMPVDGTTVNAILATGLALGTITLVEYAIGSLNTTRPWQLEAALANAGPTRLARRHNELALCQRYYEVLGSGGNGFAYSQTQVIIFYRFVVSKRVSPTMVGLKGNPAILGLPAGGYTNASNATYGFGSVANYDNSGFSVLISGYSGLTQYENVIVNDTAIIGASAEL